MDKKEKTSSVSSALYKKEGFANSPGKWRGDGAFIIDPTGKKVAMMQGALGQYELHQRRILAAVNALQDTPTQFIEELLQKCEANVILTLIARDRKMSEQLQQLQEKIAMHSGEIERLREIMEACRVFEEQRALLKKVAGMAEYEELLHKLGLR